MPFFVLNQMIVGPSVIIVVGRLFCVGMVVLGHASRQLRLSLTLILILFIVLPLLIVGLLVLQAVAKQFFVGLVDLTGLVLGQLPLFLMRHLTMCSV